MAISDIAATGSYVQKPCFLRQQDPSFRLNDDQARK